MLLCFDLDDTLLDQRGAERAAAIHLAKTFGARMTATGEAFVALWHEATKRHFQAFLRGECSFEDQRRRRICELVNADLGDAEADSLFGVYLEAYEANWRLFDDVLPCLGALSGIQKGIITNAAQAQQERKLERLGIAEHFSFVLSAQTAGSAKPDPKIFGQAATQAKAGGPLVYVGDDALMDAQAATDAGWHGIWLSRYDVIEPNFPQMLRGLEALVPYLKASGLLEPLPVM